MHVNGVRTPRRSSRCAGRAVNVHAGGGRPVVPQTLGPCVSRSSCNCAVVSGRDPGGDGATNADAASVVSSTESCAEHPVPTNAPAAATAPPTFQPFAHTATAP